MTVSQRMNYQADGGADLVIHADFAALPELIGLAEELDLRANIRTEAPIHRLNDPQGSAEPINNNG